VDVIDIQRNACDPSVFNVTGFDPIGFWFKYFISFSACNQMNALNEEFLMDPRDIVLSGELIQEFDSAQAYFIGHEAGLKVNNQIDYKRFEKMCDNVIK